MQDANDIHDRFLEHYHEHKDKLLTYLMVRLNFNREQSEDLLMDVVLKAYEHFDKFDPEKGSFKTWIFTLAHNHLINFWRDQSKKKTVSLEKLEEDGFVAATVEHEGKAYLRIENEKIQHVLSLMNGSEREIISLRYFEDMEYKEIAEVINKKEGTIRTGLSRAMKRFSEIYQKLYKEKN